MRIYTVRKRYWRLWPWPPGWHTKEVTIYEYYFPKMYVNQWGVFTRGWGCEEDGQHYSFTDPAFGVFGSTYYCGVVRKVEGKPLTSEKTCTPEYGCVDITTARPIPQWSRVNARRLSAEERAEREQRS